MALTASGQISLAGSTSGQSIAVELGQSATGTISLNDSAVRSLAAIASGVIAMNNLWGKSSVKAGALYSTGKNTGGELGNGNTTARSSFVQVGALTNWVDISYTSNHVLAIKSDGTAWGWGFGGGRLGLGANNGSYSSPKQIGSLTTWKKASAEQGSSHWIKTDGTLWASGFPTSGILGNGNSVTTVLSPVQIGSLTNWLQVSGSYYNCAAVKTDGTLWTWGANAVGQLAQGNTTARSAPLQVGALTNWAQVDMGVYSAAAVKTDGTLWTWGQGTSGGLGLGNLTNYSSPKQVGALTTWSSVNVGKYCMVALQTDGSLWGWGNSGSGQLGTGSLGASRSSPAQIGAATNWTKALTGDFQNTFAINSAGELWGTGMNITTYGQLGVGAVQYVSVLTQIGALTGWINVAAGKYSSVAIKQ